MLRTTLTDARVDTLKPRKTVRDLRVSPSGRKQLFIHCQHRGERIWKTVGDAATVSVGEARSLADEMRPAHPAKPSSKPSRRTLFSDTNGSGSRERSS